MGSVRDLARLCRSPVADPAAKDATAQVVRLLLDVGRHAAGVALDHGELAAQGPAGYEAGSRATNQLAGFIFLKTR